MSGRVSKSVLIALCFCMLVQHSLAATGDKLIVTSEIINLRAAPSTDAAVLIKLIKNKRVIEIQRQGNWIEVDTQRDDVKKGWVYKTLLKKIAEEPSVAEKRYKVFQKRFADYSKAIKKRNGTQYFATTRNKDETTIDVIATEAWLNAGIEERQTTINDVFKLWSEVVPVGLSASVRVLDEEGEQHMVMLR